MALHTIKFDRIFGVKADTRSRKEVTLFGFESQELRQESVAVPGKPGLREGDVVTVYLRLPNDWQTIVGWANHTTGELVVEDHEHESRKVLLGIVAILGVASLGLHPTLSTFLSLTLIVWVIRAALRKSSSRAVRSKLENALKSRPEVGSVSDLGQLKV